MQVAAALIFKFGSSAPGRWIPGFITGNVIGASSIWFLMLLYKRMNANVVLGFASGVSFMLTQIALAVVFRTNISSVQAAGVVSIITGIFFLSLGENRVNSFDE